MGELRVQCLAGPGGFPMPEIIGNDDEVTFRVEQLPLAEEFAGEFWPDELSAAAGGAVKNQNGISNKSVSIPSRRAKCAIMQMRFGQRFAGLKVEIGND